MSSTPNSMSKDQIDTIMQERLLSPCQHLKPFGGYYNGNCKIKDGHKFVCVEKLLQDIANNEVSFKIIFALMMHNYRNLL